MEKASDDESLEDAPSDDAGEDAQEFVEMDPSGRYGRYKEVLGKGAYKSVYKAFDDLDGIEVAWNQVKIHDVLHNAGDIERLYSELHLLKTLKHKNIIKFYTSWVDMRNRNVNFITEIFTSGTLRQYRKKHQHVKLRAIKNWSRQILRGLVFLHSRDPPIIHRDLKCDNIFINGNTGEVKIGDLGLATILRQAPAAQSVIGTPEFMAPELYEEHYNELVDVYSFGMCLLEMLTSEYPYSECTNAAQIYRKVTTGKKPAALGKIKDHETREFVEKCLASASQRLHARELLMDPFLRTDEDPEMQENKVCGSWNYGGVLQSLESIPEHAYSWAAVREDETRKRNDSSKDGSSRLDSTPKSHVSLESPSPKEGTKASMDFRIKGRKQDDKKILVRIRIANPEGEVRIIQFDFDVDADTAISVASEMVGELDLSDEDVTTISEMIDTEIMTLIPDWKPGMAFDDAVDDEMVKEQKGPIPDTASSPDENEGLQISGNLMETDTSDDPQLATGPTYGRFEEVGCNVVGSDQPVQDSDGLELFSDFSVDAGSDSSSDAPSSSEACADSDMITHCSENFETQSKLGSLQLSGPRQPETCEGSTEEERTVTVGDEKLGDSEVARLIMQQQEERQMLQIRHEEALSCLRTRLNQETSMVQDNNQQTGLLTCKISEEVCDISGKQNNSYPDAKSDAFVSVSGTPCSSTSISDAPAAAVTDFDGALPLDQVDRYGTHTMSMCKGNHGMLSCQMPETMQNEKENVYFEGEHLTDKFAVIADDNFKREADNNIMPGKAETGKDVFNKEAQVPKATPEIALLDNRSTPSVIENVKPSLPTITKRESYLEMYKAANIKDKLPSLKSSESLSTADGASKTASKDTSQEQLKKMADFADKLINNLTQSNCKYVGSSVKNAAQPGQQSGSVKSHCGTSIQSGQRSVVGKNVSSAPVPNGQHSSSVKIGSSVPSQNLQQGALVKTLPFQTSSVELMSNTAILNVQQGVSTKSVTQRATIGKCLCNGMTHCGHQSALLINHTSAPVHANEKVAASCGSASFSSGSSPKSFTSRVTKLDIQA